MDRGTWWATVPGVTTEQLSTIHTYTIPRTDTTPGTGDVDSKQDLEKRLPSCILHSSEGNRQQISNISEISEHVSVWFWLFNGIK